MITWFSSSASSPSRHAPTWPSIACASFALYPFFDLGLVA
jgi:hypothetical protein